MAHGRASLTTLSSGAGKEASESPRRWKSMANKTMGPDDRMQQLPGITTYPYAIYENGRGSHLWYAGRCELRLHLEVEMEAGWP